ncbi:MAG: hypothetical protein ACJAYU_000037 [Bradymonadia bacterium]|jgi:hypothetical protein
MNYRKASSLLGICTLSFHLIACSETTTESLEESLEEPDTGADIATGVTDAVTVGVDTAPAPDLGNVAGSSDASDSGSADTSVCSQALPRVEEPWALPRAI